MRMPRVLTCGLMVWAAILYGIYVLFFTFSAHFREKPLLYYRNFVNWGRLRMRNVISDVSDTSRGVVNISLFSKQSDTLSTYDITFDQSDHP